MCQASGQLESDGQARAGLHLLPHRQTLWAALMGLPGGLASPLGAASVWHQQGSGAGRGRGPADSSPLSALSHVFRQGLQSFLHSSRNPMRHVPRRDMRPESTALGAEQYHVPNQTRKEPQCA